MYRMVLALSFLGVSSIAVFASVPQQINHQGVVSVNGVRFNGVGSFKFAIIDPSSGINLWCNDPTDANTNGTQDCKEGIGAEPVNSVTLTVTDGIYSVLLGDSVKLANMAPIPSSVFNVPNARLRIWFDDGMNGNQMLSPDLKLTSAPYAHRTAAIPPIGSIIAWHKDFTNVPELPEGWLECDGVTVIPDGPLVGQTMPDLNPSGMFLRGSTGVSGTPQGDATSLPNDGWTVNTHTHSHTVSSQSHSHTVDGHNPGGAQITSTVEIGGSGDNADPPTSSHTHQHTLGSDPHNHTITGGDSETRPVNISVVWIMRVK